MPSYKCPFLSIHEFPLLGTRGAACQTPRHMAQRQSTGGYNERSFERVVRPVLGRLPARLPAHGQFRNFPKGGHARPALTARILSLPEGSLAM